MTTTKAILEELDECLEVQNRVLRKIAEAKSSQSVEVMASLSIRELIAFRTSVTMVKMIGGIVGIELLSRPLAEVAAVLAELKAESEARSAYAD